MRRTYLTSAAIKWALSELKKIPKDQLALLFFLMLVKSPTVKRGKHGEPSAFEIEFQKYLSGPVLGGGSAVFNPFDQQWRAADYLNSTVFGRLLNGSHKWTEGTEAFFIREPTSSWPANFRLTDRGFDNLRERTTPPCLKNSNRLPLNAMAVYYFRFLDLSEFNPQTMPDLVAEFNKTIVNKHERLKELFVSGTNFLRGELFTHSALTEPEMIACYPPSPFSGEPKKNALLYEDDIDAIKARLSSGQEIADYIRQLLRKEKIWK